VKCPNCTKPFTLLDVIKISVWAEYKCPSCNRISRRPRGNQLLTIPVIVAIPFIDRLFSEFGLLLSNVLTLVVALVGLVILTFAFGKLTLTEAIPSESNR
jgi:hypothetical protein